jgi:omega-6 fatty acid desaturase (delta-12 desaturase)
MTLQERPLAAPAAPSGLTEISDDPRIWRAALAPYATPSWKRGLLDIATSVVPYIALFALMVWSVDVSYLLTLALAIPAAGFLVRTFIVFHDCSHGSFLPSRKANAWLGAVLGVLLFTPFSKWRHAHAIHHASAGDLDRRGIGDVGTKTVAEYRAMSTGERRMYRIFRNPFVMLGIGPIFAMVIQPRIVERGDRKRLQRSVIATDLALVAMIAGLVWLLGWQTYLLVQVPLIFLAGATGIWLFYVQHQFEDVYWASGDDWNYAEAALRGSSYLKLPRVLQFFSGNIGLHHVHHLSARVPNYNLQAAHDDNPVFHSVPVMTLGSAMRAFNLKLYDEESGRMVGWAAAR